MENYEKKVANFYRCKGIDKIFEYKKEIENEYGLEIKALKWDEKKGLTNIALSSDASIFLVLSSVLKKSKKLSEIVSYFSTDKIIDSNFSRYIFHKIYVISEKESKILFSIAKRYLELLEKE